MNSHVLSAMFGVGEFNIRLKKKTGNHRNVKNEICCGLSMPHAMVI